MKNKWLLLALAITICGFINVFNIGSCQWTDYLGNPQRTAYSSYDGPDLPTILWRVSIPGDFDTSPFIMDNKVVAVWKNSRFHLWETKVVFLDILTGEILQEIKPDDLIFKAFPVNQQIFGISGEKVYQINYNLGEVSFLTSLPEKSFVMTNMYPLALENKIIIPTTPVVCFSQSDFHLLWNLEEKIPHHELRPVSLAGDDTLVVFIMATDEGVRVFAVDPSTGALKWKSDVLAAAHWIALGEETIYCARERLWAFSRKGSVLWEFVSEEEIASNIVVSPDAVYIADAGNTLYKIDLDGNIVWKADWKVSFWNRETHLLGAGDILYGIANYGDYGSQMSAFNMEDGKRLWDFEFEAPEWIKGSPVALVKGAPPVANGILVIGTMGGEILAVASDPDIFVKQGDAFVEMGSDENAAESYKKALELCDEKGLTEKYQEILEHVVQRGFTQFGTPEPPVQTQSPPPSETAPPESTLPDTVPPRTEPSQSPPPGPESPEPSPQLPEWYLVAVAGIIIGIFAIYAWQKYK